MISQLPLLRTHVPSTSVVKAACAVLIPDMSLHSESIIVRVYEYIRTLSFRQCLTDMSSSFGYFDSYAPLLHPFGRPNLDMCVESAGLGEV